MTSPPDILSRAEAAEAALETASELLAELGDEFAQMRRLTAQALAHLRALERGEPAAPLIWLAPTETLQ